MIHDLMLGAAAHIARYRLRYYQQISRTGMGQLSERMRELGHPLSPQRVGQALNGFRRIPTDDLTAMATALGVPASRIVLDTAPALDHSVATKFTSELHAQLAQARLERDGLESRFRWSEGPRGHEISTLGKVLAALEERSIRIEVLTIEIERRSFGNLHTS